MCWIWQQFSTPTLRHGQLDGWTCSTVKIFWNEIPVLSISAPYTYILIIPCTYCSNHWPAAPINSNLHKFTAHFIRAESTARLPSVFGAHQSDSVSRIFVSQANYGWPDWFPAGSRGVPNGHQKLPKYEGYQCLSCGTSLQKTITSTSKFAMYWADFSILDTRTQFATGSWKSKMNKIIERRYLEMPTCIGYTARTGCESVKLPCECASSHDWWRFWRYAFQNSIFFIPKLAIWLALVE